MTMKSSTCALILACILVPAGCLSPGRPVESESPGPTELCDVTSRIAEYDGKSVQIIGRIRGYHSPILYSEKCAGPENVILLDADRQTISDLLRRMGETAINRRRTEIAGEIVVEGQIQKDRGTLFEYEYEVQRVETNNLGAVSILRVHKIGSAEVLKFTPATGEGH